MKVLVVGASRGLGHEFVRQYRAEGTRHAAGASINLLTDPRDAADR